MYFGVTFAQNCSSYAFTAAFFVNSEIRRWHLPRDDVGQRDRLGEAGEDEGRGEDRKDNLSSERKKKQADVVEGKHR